MSIDEYLATLAPDQAEHVHGVMASAPDLSSAQCDRVATLLFSGIQ